MSATLTLESSVSAPEWLKDGAILGGGAGISAAFSAVAKAWRKPSAPDEMIAAAKDAAMDMLSELRAEVGRLSARITDIEAQNAKCEGENRQLWTAIHARDRILRENGIAIPMEALPNTLVVMEKGKTTVFKARSEGEG